MALVAPSAMVVAQRAPVRRDFQSGIDARHYVFHVVLPDSGRRIEVWAAVYLRRTKAVDSVQLDLDSAMTVHSAILNGRDVTFARDARSVRIALRPWNSRCADSTFARNPDRPDPCTDWILLRATGQPTRGLVVSRDNAGRWRYYTDHWPDHARGWLPVIDRPTDKATVEWRVHAPSSLRVVANGRQLEESTIPNEPGRSITVWRTETPIPTFSMAMSAAPRSRIDPDADVLALITQR